MDYSAEIEKAKKLLDKGDFILCSVKCGMILEDILKNLLNNLYNNLKGAANKNAIRQSYPYNEKLTLGKLIKIFKKTDVFRLTSDFYKIDKRKLNDIDFDTMLRIRNKAAHERRDDLEDAAIADTYIMYGYLLKLLSIFSPVLAVPQKITAIKSSIVQKPQYSQEKSRTTDFEPDKVVLRQKKRTIIPASGMNNKTIPKDTIEVCKNKRSGQFFIQLDRISINKSNYIIPDGKIRALSSDLFDEVEVLEKKFLLMNNFITPEQSEKLKFYENELNSNRIDPPILKRDSGEEPGYIKKYRKMIGSPNTVPSIMLRCIKSTGTIRWKDLKRILIERYNYKDSGSFGASLRVLEIDGHINIDGSGDEKLIS